MNKIFYSELSIDHPIIKNHMVNEQLLLPGLGYIDMLYQLAVHGLKMDYQSHILKRLAIFNPLIVNEHEPLKIKIIFTQTGEYIRIQVKDDNQLYASAELHKGIPVLNETIDIEKIKETALQTTDLHDVYEGARKVGIIHQNLLKAEGMIYENDTGCLTKISVGEKYRDRESSILFHPTLIDSAGLAAVKIINTIIPHAGEDSFFLPLSYNSFYGKEPLRDECYMRIKTSSIQLVNDIYRYNIDFFTTSGVLAAKLEGITAKQVRYKDQLKKVYAKKTGGDKNEKSDTPGSHGSQDKTGSSVMDNGSAEDIEKTLKEIFSGYLNKTLEPMDMDIGFYELGLDSSQLMNLVNDIETSFNITVSPSLLFEYSNMNDLLGYFKNEVHTLKDSSSIDSGSRDNNSGVHVLSRGYFEFHEQEPYLQDHKVFDQPALMGITYPCLAIESYIQNNPGSFPVEVNNVQFMGGPVGLKPDERIHVCIEFENKDKGIGFESSYYIHDSSQGVSCCKGDIIGPFYREAEAIDIETLIKQSARLSDTSIKKCYQLIKDFHIGPMLQTIDSAYEHHTSLLIGKIDITGKQEKGNKKDFFFDSLVLNACYLLGNPETIDRNSFDDNIYIPLLIEKMTVYKPIPAVSYIVKTTRIKKDDFISFDALIVAENGEIIAEIINASVKLVRSSTQLTSIDSTKSRDTTVSRKQDDIAIIGIAGRYPGARNLYEFWDNLQSGKDCITVIPEDRWDWEEHFDADKNKIGKIYTKWGGFIDGVDEFDPLFFNITKREAEYMDPQERLFLMCAYSTLEDAGYTPQSFKKEQNSGLGGNVGVFAGVMYEEYQFYGIQEQAHGRTLAISGNPASIPNRVSYVFNFYGPSIAVDTMCSSSLTTVYLACQSIRNGDCDAALAGGVNASLHPNKYLLHSQGKFASSKGRCESFGNSGDGYVPGEGVGVVLLKSLSKAIEDGDHIYGVIKGCKLNAGGKTSGFTVPNPTAQGKVIFDAIERAGINARSISYIEAHGTGTSLGDPIEITGLTKAFRKFTDDNQFCSIGSVKSNIGHLESAAGIAAITKVLLQLRYKKLVPSLHSDVLNPNIDFSKTPFVVQRELADWKSDSPRIAGISSFGAGGANAHIIIEEYEDNAPAKAYKTSFTGPAVIIMSAATQERLVEYAKNLLNTIEKEKYGNEHLHSIAYTLQTGRKGLNERLGFIVKDIDELKKILSHYVGGEGKKSTLFQGEVRKNQDTISLFLADDDLQKALGNWIQKRKYDKILNVWVKGLPVKWERFYDGQKPKKIILPGYPFAREKYWIKEVKKKKKVKQQESVMVSENPFAFS